MTKGVRSTTKIPHYETQLTTKGGGNQRPWGPVGGLMLENFIQSGANLVQLFILIVKHREKKLKLFFFTGLIFLDLQKV